jgi:hypothetical protein
VKGNEMNCRAGRKQAENPSRFPPFYVFLGILGHFRQKIIYKPNRQNRQIAPYGPRTSNVFYSVLRVLRVFRGEFIFSLQFRCAAALREFPS